MDRNGRIAVVLVLILMAADVTNGASSIFSAFRRFVAVASTSSATNDSNNQVSPSPSPDPLQTGNKTTSNQTTTNTAAASSSKAVDLNNANNGTNSGNNTKTLVPSPVVNKEQNEKKNGQTTPPIDNKNEDQAKPKPSEVGGSSSRGGAQNCSGILRRCKDNASLVACILNSYPEHKIIEVLVQNEGEENLKVEIAAPDRVTHTITKHQSKEINITVGENSQVILEAGNGECVLHKDIPGSQGNFFLNLPSYDRLITPINGAYFLIFTVLIFGGMSICCMFRKRKQRDGIPYQELEMGLPESSLANNVETAESWDEGWDDDWDEGNAVKSPVARHSGSLSSNGLTSRSLKRDGDGWENDWDN